MKIRCYTELMELKTFEERFDYLRIKEGSDRFGFGPERYINQNFYRSKEWKWIRDTILCRDEWDLGIFGYDIGDRPIIHHMNPITKEDIVERREIVYNPEYLILCSKETHEAIHKGGFVKEDIGLLHSVERKPNDTLLWRKR